MSSGGRYVAWVHGSSLAITVVDRQTDTSATYDLDTLRPSSVEARSVSGLVALSDDGRFLTYGLHFFSTTESFSTVVRLDRNDGSHLVLFTNNPYRYDPVLGTIARALVSAGLSRDGQTFTWVQAVTSPLPARQTEVQVLVRRASEPEAQVIGTTCQVPTWPVPTTCLSAISGDGKTVMYAAGETLPGALAYYDVATGAKTYYPQVQPRSISATSIDASYVIARPHLGDAVLFDRPRMRIDELAGSVSAYIPTGVSDDGTRVLLTAPGPDTWSSALLDRASGLRYDLGPDERGLAITRDGSAVLVLKRDLDLQAFVLLVRTLDDDGDGMLDGWESFFGLDPTNAADAALDSNADGKTNLQTFAERGHPTAVASATRLFAEGAGGAFFDTSVSLFNAGANDATAVIRFLGANGQQTSQAVALPSLQRTDIASCCLPTLDATEFSIVVESTRPLVAERRMTWDRTTGFGSHASAATPAAATTWHFAEGATIAGFQTFYLLQNPGTAAATVSVDYLLADGTTVSRAYVVAPESRYTVWANQEGAPLDAAEFAATVSASQPIVAERAMYRPALGQPFGAGSNAMGVTTPATSWSFAEGATGDFFDTFILVANTSDTPGTVTAEYRATDEGGVPLTISKAYSVAARSRLTIWIDQEDAQLASTAVSTVITADVPVVAERSMWWPGSADTWAESHTEFGATESGLRWAVADAELNPTTGTDTFVLVDADTAGTPATARVVVYPSTGGPITREVPLVAGRNTLWMADLFPEVGGQRFSVVIESLDRPGGAAPLRVEKAVYSRWFDAGAASLATRIP